MKFYTGWVLALVLLAAPAVAQSHADLVAAVKANLLLAGQTFTTNCDAFEITRRVAWLLRQEGARLIGKTSAQNGCEFGGRKYSHDALAFPTGWIDLLASAGPPLNENRPAWESTGTDPNAPLFPPFEVGDSPPLVVVGPPTPIPPPVFDTGSLVQRLLVIENEVIAVKAEGRETHALAAEAVAEIKAHRTGVQQVWLRVTAIGGPIVTALITYVQMRGGAEPQ